MDDCELYRDLLMEMLNCGIRDLETALRWIKVARKMGISIPEIICRLRELFDYRDVDAYDINSLIYSTMDLIREKLADEARKRGLGEEVVEKILDHEFYVNYSDSWFNMPELDYLSDSELEKIGGKELIERVLKRFT